MFYTFFDTVRTAKNATVWSFIDQFATQIIGFCITIFLARLLNPADYGLIGICSIFIAFAGIFIECGLSNALIRKLDRTEADLNTAFYFNLAVGLAVYFVLFFSAPLIADYFDAESLVAILRIVGITVIFNSLCIVQNALLTASYQIKVQTIVKMGTQIPMGMIAIFMAYRGLGVYSLAVQTAGVSVLSTVLLWSIAKWRPRLMFDRKSMVYLWGFGSKLLGANILGTVFNEIYSVLIGKYVGKTDLGYYTQGRNLAMKPNMMFIGVIQKVAIPYLSMLQNDYRELLRRYRICCQVVMLSMTFVAGLCIINASPFIQIIWGNKWINSITIFQLIMLTVILSPLGTLNLVLLQIVNKTGYTLKMEFIKKPVAVTAIFFALNWGIKGLLCAQIFLSLFEFALNMTAPKRYIGYGYKGQISDFLPYVFYLAVALIATHLIVGFLPDNLILQLLSRSVLFSLLLVAIPFIRRDETMRFLTIQATNYLTPLFRK